MSSVIRRVIPISDFKDARRVRKFGRTTGLTTGRFSFIKSQVLLSDYPCKTTEHVFCSPHGLFSNFGDPGAWVFDEMGDLGGMVVGGHLQQWSFVTPLIRIFEDIEVVLPDPYDTG